MKLFTYRNRRNFGRHYAADRNARRMAKAFVGSALRFTICAFITLSLVGLSNQAHGLAETSEEAPVEVPAEESDSLLEAFDAMPARQRGSRRERELVSMSVAFPWIEIPGIKLSSRVIARCRPTAIAKRGHMLPPGVNAPLLI